MRVAIYTPAAGIPPEAEAIADQYDEEDQVLFRNGSVYGGEIERVAKVYAHQEEVREAYEANDIPAEPLFPEFDPVPEEDREKGKDFYLRHKGGRYFNVVSVEGEPANEKGLEKEEAKALRNELNGVEQDGGDASEGGEDA